MNVFLFSGQGSQYARMGLPFWRSSAVYREWMERLDAQAGAEIGAGPLARLYPEGAASADLADICWSHPALFMAQYASARAAMAEGLQPDLVIGASLGEYVALGLGDPAGPQSLFSALNSQVRFLRERCRPGGMLVAFGSARLFADRPRLQAVCSLVSAYAGGFFLLSGGRDGMEAAVRILEEEKTPYSPLPVAFGFHSPNVDPARTPFLSFVDRMAFRAGGIPCFSCATADWIRRLEPAHLWDIVRGPLRVTDAIRNLERNGPHRYFDFSPSGTMMNLGRPSLEPGGGSEFFPVFSRCRDGLASLGEWASGAGPVPEMRVAT
jgi:trans-AT polyketide synthase/acyltransferase/oxidoreductase domain-containing protein